MRKSFLGLVGLLMFSVVLTGCNTGDVSTADMDAVKEEMSRENYEKAMKEAGRGDELEKEKAEAERRRQSDYGE
jgi:hypothetical protein